MLRFIKSIILVVVAFPVAGLVALVASAWIYEIWNTYSYSYRLTIEVETLDGVKCEVKHLGLDRIPERGGRLKARPYSSISARASM